MYMLRRVYKAKHRQGKHVASLVQKQTENLRICRPFEGNCLLQCWDGSGRTPTS